MMQFDFDTARITQDGELCLKVKNLPAARQLVLSMKNRTYTCEVKEQHKKRSLDANAYFWVLADKLAEATRIPKEEIYREAIRGIGGNSDTVCVKASAADKLCEIWRARGLGWLADQFPSKLPGCVNVTLYSGSSTYDTRQMSRLIDNIVQDCQAVGIETMTPDKLALLVEEWGGAK